MNNNYDRVILKLKQESLRARTEADTLRHQTNVLNMELNRPIYKVARLQLSIIRNTPGFFWATKKLYNTLLPIWHARRGRGQQNILIKDTVSSFIDVLAASNGINYTLSTEWYDKNNPTVSIIVLNWNKGNLTSQCLNEVWKNTSGVKYEIIVLDNGSTSDQIDPLMNLSGPFKLIKLTRNRLFGEGNNIAAEQAKGEYLLFLNNDAFVTPGWLVPLVEAMHDQRVGASGPMFLYPDGVVQECGSFIDVNGDPKQRGKGLEKPLQTTLDIQDVHYISAACLLMRKNLYITLNGFSLDFEPAYYEDVDLCFRLRKLGYAVRYIPNSRVVHIENYSHRETGNVMRIGIAINRDKFVMTHSSIIGHDDIPDFIIEDDANKSSHGNTMNRDYTEFEYCSGMRIGLYTPFDITPGGGERFLLTLASELSISNSVTLITPCIYSYSRLRQIGYIFNIDVSKITMARYDLALSLSFDAFISMGNQIVPDVPALAPFSVYLCQFPFPISRRHAYDTSYLLDGYKKYIAYSEFSRSHILSTLKSLGIAELPVHVIYPPCDVSTKPQTREKKIIKILSVGRFFPGGHCKNYHLLVPLFQKLLDSNELNGVDIEYHIAGSIHANQESLEYFHKIKDIGHGLPLVLHPNVDFNTLCELYSTSHIYWHGTGMGKDPDEQPEAMEHFGISIVEAMGAGCVPVAFDAGGPSEIITSGANGFLFKTDDQLIMKSLLLINDNNILREMSLSATDRSRHFSVDKFSRSLDRLFSEM